MPDLIKENAEAREWLEEIRVNHSCNHVFGSYVGSVIWSDEVGQDGQLIVPADPSQLVALGWDYFDTKALRRGAEFAALAAEKIGEPLVRGSLSEHYIPSYDRKREYLLAAR